MILLPISELVLRPHPQGSVPQGCLDMDPAVRSINSSSGESIQQTVVLISPPLVSRRSRPYFLKSLMSPKYWFFTFCEESGVPGGRFSWACRGR